MCSREYVEAFLARELTDSGQCFYFFYLNQKFLTLCYTSAQVFNTVIIIRKQLVSLPQLRVSAFIKKAIIRLRKKVKVQCSPTTVNFYVILIEY